MKQILFLTRLFHPHIGGVEKHVEQISKHLNGQYQITIITEQYKKKLTEKESIAFSLSRNVQGEPFPEWKPQDIPGKITIYRIPTWNISEKQKKWRIWQWLWQHRQLIRGADIIHIHDVFFWWLPFRFLFPHKKVFITFHGYETKFPPSHSGVWQKKLAALLTRGNICVGDYISKWYGVKPTFVTYGATDQKPLPLPKKHAILVFGRLSRDNAMDKVIDTLKSVKKIYPSLSVTFLGDGEFKNPAKKIGSVTGFLFDTTKYRSKASLVIASSYLSILDSLAAGRQVISIYSNPLKHDYLRLSPMAKYITITSSVKELIVTLNHHLKSHIKLNRSDQSWAQTQTWQKVVAAYKTLWQGNNSRATVRGSYARPL